MTFPSVYEMFDPLTRVRKQHFWDWFSGDDLKSIWTLENHSGTGSGAMADSVDGGYSVTSGTNANERTGIHFNQIHPWAHDGSVLIGVIKPTTGTNNLITLGLDENDEPSPGTEDLVIYRDDTNDSFSKISTADGTTKTSIFTDISSGGTSWIGVKIELNGSNAKLTLDGTLKATKTTNLPLQKMQPIFLNMTRTTAARTGSIRYMECYNT